MKKNTLNPNKTSFLQRIHIDGWLFLSLLVLMSVGLVTLYSASGQDSGQVERQITRLALSVAVMFGIAQIPPRRISPPVDIRLYRGAANAYRGIVIWRHG